MAEYLSPSKLNLFFQLIKKRDDGYHEIASLFQSVNLFDHISVKLSKKDSFKSTDPSLKYDSTNLIIKALNLFREKTKLSFNVDISLVKNIPKEAGLGGGSSNAATMLWALNELSNFPLTLTELKDLAIQIGSDVPFFLSNGTAFCQGRGEIIKEIDKELNFSFTIAKPHFGLSTAKVYQNVKINILPKTNSDLVLQEFIQNKNPHFFNDLEYSAFEICPKLTKVKKDLLNLGFSSVIMTGSGSSFFCIGDVKEPFLKEVDFYFVQTIQRNPKKWYSF